MAKPKPKPSTKAAQPTAPAKKKREGGNGRGRQISTAQAREIAAAAGVKLKPKEWAVVWLLVDPETMGLSVKAQAERLSLTRQGLWEIKNRPHVQTVLQRLCLAHAASAADLMLEKAIESGKLPGKDGHYDRRLVLEMAGAYSRTSTTKHEGAIEHKHTAKLEDKLNAARRQSQQAAKQLAREEVVGFDDNEGPIIDADWQEEPTTSSGDEGS